MPRLTAKQRAARESSRDLNAELREGLTDAQHGRWARKTEFVPLANGCMRRRITRRDGTVEKNELIPAGRVGIVAARAGTGLSQSSFAKLLGVSVRTLQDWEAGRREPSGAAQTLLRIAIQHPRVLREVAVFPSS